jgi:hypothetical protein
MALWQHTGNAEKDIITSTRPTLVGATHTTEYCFAGTALLL